MPTPRKVSDRKIDFTPLLLVFLCVFCTWRTLGHYFLGDDFLELTRCYEDGALRSGVSIFADYFTPAEHPESWAFVRPTWKFLYWWDSVWWGTNAIGFRLSTATLQVAAILGIYFLALRVRLPKILAFSWAALLAVHPLSVESYSWIAARSDIMVTAFGTWGTWFLLGPEIDAHSERGSVPFRNRLLGVIGIFLAVTSKETGIVYLVLPLALGISRRATRTGLGPTLRESRTCFFVAMSALLGIAYLLYRHRILGQVVGGYKGLGVPFLRSFGSTYQLLRSFAWPSDPLGSSTALFLLLASLLAGAWLYRHKWSQSLGLLALLLVLTTLGHVIVSPFNFSHGVYGSMRLGYAMLLPFCLYTALGLLSAAEILSRVARSKAVRLPVFAVLMATLGILAVIRQQGILTEFDQASQATRSFVREIRKLKKLVPRTGQAIAYDVPTQNGAAFVCLNAEWIVNSPPFFRDKPPFLQCRLDNPTGWELLARDLSLPEDNRQLRHWSHEESRFVIATPPKLVKQTGRIHYSRSYNQTPVYSLDGSEDRLVFAERPLKEANGQEHVLSGYRIQARDAIYFLVVDQIRRSGPAARVPEPSKDEDGRTRVCLRQDADTLSREHGGTLHFDIEALPRLARHPYMLVGSMSGPSRTPLSESESLPLRFDPYSHVLFSNPNLWLQQSFGILDGSGKARATFLLPAAHPLAKVGMELRHVCVVLRKDLKSVEAVSAATVFTISK